MVKSQYNENLHCSSSSQGQIETKLLQNFTAASCKTLLFRSTAVNTLFKIHLHLALPYKEVSLSSTFSKIQRRISKLATLSGAVLLFFRATVDIQFLKQGPASKNKDQILIKDPISNKWKYKTKQARLILQTDFKFNNWLKIRETKRLICSELRMARMIQGHPTRI